MYHADLSYLHRTPTSAGTSLQKQRAQQGGQPSFIVPLVDLRHNEVRLTLADREGRVRFPYAALTEHEVRSFARIYDRPLLTEVPQLATEVARCLVPTEDLAAASYLWFDPRWLEHWDTLVQCDRPPLRQALRWTSGWVPVSHAFRYGSTNAVEVNIGLTDLSQPRTTRGATLRLDPEVVLRAFRYVHPQGGGYLYQQRAAALRYHLEAGCLQLCRQLSEVVAQTDPVPVC